MTFLKKGVTIIIEEMKRSTIMIQFNSKDFPDIDALSLPELKEYQQELIRRIEALDEQEPASMESDAYEVWGDAHEALEDLLDDVQDRLDDLEE